MRTEEFLKEKVEEVSVEFKRPPPKMPISNKKKEAYTFKEINEIYRKLEKLLLAEIFLRPEGVEVSSTGSVNASSSRTIYFGSDLWVYLQVRGDKYKLIISKKLLNELGKRPEEVKAKDIFQFFEERVAEWTRYRRHVEELERKGASFSWERERGVASRWLLPYRDKRDKALFNLIGVLEDLKKWGLSKQVKVVFCEGDAPGYLDYYNCYEETRCYGLVYWDPRDGILYLAKEPFQHFLSRELRDREEKSFEEALKALKELEKRWKRLWEVAERRGVDPYSLPKLSWYEPLIVLRGPVPTLSRVLGEEELRTIDDMLWIIDVAQASGNGDLLKVSVVEKVGRGKFEGIYFCEERCFLVTPKVAELMGELSIEGLKKALRFCRRKIKNVRKWYREDRIPRCCLPELGVEINVSDLLLFPEEGLRKVRIIKEILKIARERGEEVRECSHHPFGVYWDPYWRELGVWKGSSYEDEPQKHFYEYFGKTPEEWERKLETYLKFLRAKGTSPEEIRKKLLEKEGWYWKVYIVNKDFSNLSDKVFDYLCALRDLMEGAKCIGLEDCIVPKKCRKCKEGKGAVGLGDIHPSFLLISFFGEADFESALLKLRKTTEFLFEDDLKDLKIFKRKLKEAKKLLKGLIALGAGDVPMFEVIEGGPLFNAYGHPQWHIVVGTTKNLRDVRDLPPEEFEKLKKAVEIWSKLQRREVWALIEAERPKFRLEAYLDLSTPVIVVNPWLLHPWLPFISHRLLEMAGIDLEKEKMGTKIKGCSHPEMQEPDKTYLTPREVLRVLERLEEKL